MPMRLGPVRSGARHAVAVLVVVATVSIRWSWLSLPAAFASFIAALSLPALRAGGVQRAGLWVLLSGMIATAAVGRFLITEAMPGIVQGGRVAVQRKAVSRLREILFAQDAVRRAAWIDTDGDGRGAAAFLDELCGGPPRRGQSRNEHPVLRCGPRSPSGLGPATREGTYRFAVCLPTRDGGFSGALDAAVDEQRAEVDFAAYAWPADGQFDTAFYLDWEENILQRSVPEQAEPGAWTPHCGEGPQRADDGPWRPWRGKKARSRPAGE